MQFVDRRICFCISCHVFYSRAQLQYYRRSNVEISGGTLKLHARREPYLNHSYTSAKLVTTSSWLYGVVSIRARFTSALGTWPALWMMPSRFAYGAWPRSGEMDIMESVGYNGSYVFASLNTGAFNQFLGTHRGGQVRVDGHEWHIYSLNWGPGRLDFGVDNRVYYSFVRQATFTVETWPFDQEFYLIVNLAVGGQWGGRAGVNGSAFDGLGQVLEVDWVSVSPWRARD